MFFYDFEYYSKNIFEIFCHRCAPGSYDVLKGVPCRAASVPAVKPCAARWARLSSGGGLSHFLCMALLGVGAWQVQDPDPASPTLIYNINLVGEGRSDSLKETLAPGLPARILRGGPGPPRPRNVSFAFV